MGSRRTKSVAEAGVCHETLTVLFSKMSYKFQQMDMSSSEHLLTTLGPGLFTATSTTTSSMAWQWSSSLESHTAGLWDQTRHKLLTTRTRCVSISCDMFLIYQNWPKIR